MRERPDGLITSQVDHARAARTDGFDLSPVILDVAVPCDDEPLLAGSLGDPHVVGSADICDRARCSYPAPFDRTARIAWVGDVPSDLHKDLRQAEDVSVDVVADDGRLRRLAHAARAEIS